MATVTKTGDFINGGNQMMALNLCCHTDGGHWLWATEALKLFLRQTKFTMVEIFSDGSIYNGFKCFCSNPNSQWVQIFSKGSIYNGLKLLLIQHRFEMGWNLFWMDKDSQSLSKLYLLQKYDFCMPLDFLGIKYFKKMKIWILDNTVVFLAFMVLKVKTKVLTQFSMLVDLNLTPKHFRTKYPISIHCVLVGASWKFTQYPQKTWHKFTCLIKSRARHSSIYKLKSRNLF